MADVSAAPTIRKATLADADELARLRWDFTAELHHADEDLAAFAPRLTEALEGFLQSGRWTIWVADVGQQLVGTVWVERVDKVPRPYERPLHWGYVTNVYVAPDHRNIGVGTRLVDAAVTEARAAGWQLLLLWPSELSNTFYARAGFRSSADALERHLESETNR